MFEIADMRMLGIGTLGMRILGMRMLGMRIFGMRMLGMIILVGMRISDRVVARFVIG